MFVYVRARARERERGRETVCVCVCVCALHVYVYAVEGVCITFINIRNVNISCQLLRGRGYKETSI